MYRLLSPVVFCVWHFNDWLYLCILGCVVVVVVATFVLLRSRQRHRIESTGYALRVLLKLNLLHGRYREHVVVYRCQAQGHNCQSHSQRFCQSLSTCHASTVNVCIHFTVTWIIQLPTFCSRSTASFHPERSSLVVVPAPLSHDSRPSDAKWCQGYPILPMTHFALIALPALTKASHTPQAKSNVSTSTSSIKYLSRILQHSQLSVKLEFKVSRQNLCNDDATRRVQESNCDDWTFVTKCARVRLKCFWHRVYGIPSTMTTWNIAITEAPQAVHMQGRNVSEDSNPSHTPCPCWVLERPTSEWGCDKLPPPLDWWMNARY